jgi:hypothetical protein
VSFITLISYVILNKCKIALFFLKKMKEDLDDIYHIK